MTYKSSVGLEHISVNNTTTIPPPTSLPESDSTKEIENCTVCFFGLETSGLSDDCEFVQFSAVDFDGLRLFDQYFYPEALVLGQQKLQVLQSHQESCFVMGH